MTSNVLKKDLVDAILSISGVLAFAIAASGCSDTAPINANDIAEEKNEEQDEENPEADPKIDPDADPDADVDADPDPDENPDAEPTVQCADPNDNDAVELLAADITEDTVLGCDKVWLLDDQQIYVKGATLTVDPGTTIKGRGIAALVIEKDAAIHAVGTSDAPIVMTSAEAEPTRGDWGGLVLLGNAVANIGVDASAEGFVNPPTYGGDDDSHNCGTMQYLRVEWAGFAVSEGNELNGITFYACGSKTVVDHVQVHMGQDDGIEFFGGTFNPHHLVITGAADDSLDIDQGFRGNIQHVLIAQDPTVGDNGFEISNQGTDFSALPLNAPNIANATVIGGGSANDVKSKGFTLKEGTKATIRNSVFTNAKNGAILVTHQSTQDVWEDGGIVISNNLFYSNGDPEFVVGTKEGESLTWDDAGLEIQIKDEGNGNVFSDPALASLKWGKTDASPSDVVTGIGTDLGDGFDSTNYAGAIDPAGDDWTQEGWVIR